MNIFDEYIKAISLVYDKPDSLVHIVDKDGKFIYVSEEFKNFFNFSQQETESFFDVNYNENINHRIQKAHNYVLETGNPVKYMIMGEYIEGRIGLFRGARYPIYENLDIVGVLTIHNRLKSFNVFSSANQDYCFDLYGYKLSYVEELILFYASMKFTHGEAYRFIEQFSEPKLKYENYKYYTKQLLKKFAAESMKDIVEKVEVLREAKFIPHKLLKPSICFYKD